MKIIFIVKNHELVKALNPGDQVKIHWNRFYIHNKIGFHQEHFVTFFEKNIKDNHYCNFELNV